MNKHTEEAHWRKQAEKQEERETRIAAVAPGVWKSKRDVRAKAKLQPWTPKGDLQSKVTMQTSMINTLKQCQKRYNLHICIISNAGSKKVTQVPNKVEVFSPIQISAKLNQK